MQILARNAQYYFLSQTQEGRKRKNRSCASILIAVSHKHSETQLLNFHLTRILLEKINSYSIYLTNLTRFFDFI